MGADGSVFVWEFDVARSKHRELHGRDLESDWWFLRKGNVRLVLGGVEYIVAYHEHGTDDVHCSFHDPFWFGEHELQADAERDAAMGRVNATLEAVEPRSTEVWT